MKRRTLLGFGAGMAAGFVPLARIARAQDPAANWPAKTVRLIIPFTPGGRTGFQAMSWHGVAFPAGTPPSIVDKLSAAIQRAMASAEMQEKYAGGGSRAIAMTPQQFAAYIREDTERWAPVIRASGAKVE